MVLAVGSDSGRKQPKGVCNRSPSLRAPLRPRDVQVRMGTWFADGVITREIRASFPSPGASAKQDPKLDAQASASRGPPDLRLLWRYRESRAA